MPAIGVRIAIYSQRDRTGSPSPGDEVTADSNTVTADSNNVTADGGAI